MIATTVSLRRFSRADLPTVAPWFLDPETQRFLGGPDWPAQMLARARVVGETFRGATHTGCGRRRVALVGDADPAPR